MLWIDEIEKAFAGVGGEGGGNDDYTVVWSVPDLDAGKREHGLYCGDRNDISVCRRILRKGRFDELFCGFAQWNRAPEDF